MPIARVTERTLYRFISEFLTSKGVNSVNEVQVHSIPDLLFQIGNDKFVLEAKIGEEGIFEGIAQLERQARELETQNKILIAFPESVRIGLLRVDEQRIRRLALEENLLFGVVLTEFLTKSYRNQNLSTILLELLKSTKEREFVYEPKVAIDTLREGLNILKSRISSERNIENIENEVASRFDLFSAIRPEETTREEFKNIALELAAYILLNQILFYRIFSEKTSQTPKINTVLTKNDLSEYFRNIKQIDFKPIYSVDVLSLLPNGSDINQVLKQVTDAISALRPERLEHDLPGRLFHDLLPPNTRKVLAAFYTRPVAAELLSVLTITRGDEKVIDVACGSGTLLVSAYHRKKNLLLQSRQEENLHKRILENEITGIDIMPFAAHLTAVNLAAQDVKEVTNKLQVATNDSLQLKAGQALSTVGQMGRQMSLIDRDVRPERVEIDDTGNGKDSLTVENYDTLIMNPPFTKQERLPQDYAAIVANNWGRLSGKSVGLWGNFLFLANELVVNDGTIGAIIPANYLRGRESKQCREFFLENNFYWKYILTPTVNYAFSESSEYKDIIWIATKNPQRIGLTGIVLIKKNLAELDLLAAKRMSEKIISISEGTEHTENDFDIYWKDREFLLKNKQNLMLLISVSSNDNRSKLNSYIDDFQKNVNTEYLSEAIFLEGFRPVPKGISDLIFFTRKVGTGRTMYANLVINKEEDGMVIAKHNKRENFDVQQERTYLLPSMRTPVGYSTFDITDKHDYLLTAPYDGIEEISMYSDFSGEPNWSDIRSRAMGTATNLAICRRINPFSPSQHFMAFYSDKTIYPSNQLHSVVTKNKDNAKILCMLFNSTYFFIQFFLYREVSTGRRIDIRQSDLESIKLPNVESLDSVKKAKLLELFEDMKNISFPSLMQQYETKDNARLELDSKLLEIFSERKSISKNNLGEIYDVLLEEMKRVKNLRRD